MKTFASTAMRAALPWVLLVLLTASHAHAQRLTPASYASDLKTVRALLQQPESQMDLGVIKLTVDRMIDPSIDVAATTKQIDDLAAEIRATFPPGASNLVKFKALRDYLYRPPLLSGRLPYLYDLQDDRNPRAKLLPVYLSTRRGNCISMPTLFVILGQKLGIPVALASAPEHLYLKFRGDNGQWYGVEATNGGGWADDEVQRKNFPSITPESIANGVYLQPLTRKEAAIATIDSLLEHYQAQNTDDADEARIELALADTTFILEANVVTDKQVVLTAKRVWYYSENDEAAFFEWLDKLPCVEKYEGELDMLEIYINQARLDAGSLYELLALFRRYNIDMTQLRVFDRDEFASWFRNPKSYWFKEVFE